MKARLETAYGEWVERIPAWIRWATQVCPQLSCVTPGNTIVASTPLHWLESKLHVEQTHSTHYAR